MVDSDDDDEMLLDAATDEEAADSSQGREGEKALLIRHIFDKLWDEGSHRLTRTIVFDHDIREAKAALDEIHTLKIKAGNPNNFFKDIVRRKKAFQLWPESLRSLGWTGEQRTGGGQVFEFVQISEEWPDNLAIDLEPSPETPRHIVQTLSIPLWTKELGRSDEPWLLQSAVNLRVVETHFALSPSQIPPLSMTHLQMDLKLRKTQIDALYLLQFDQGAGRPAGFAHVTVEAKQHNQRIIPEQVGWQAEAALKNKKADIVIPIAIAAVRGDGIYVVNSPEFSRRPRCSFSAAVRTRREAAFRS